MKLNNPTDTALTAFIIVQVVMLFSIFFQAPPHPPYTTPLFAMGPFLAASLAICAAALCEGSERTSRGKVLSVLSVVGAMASYGPQKWFDPAAAQIWPAVLTIQIAALIILIRIFGNRNAPAET